MMHVVGASADSELWGWDGKNEQQSLPPDAASSYSG